MKYLLYPIFLLSLQAYAEDFVFVDAVNFLSPEEASKVWSQVDVHVSHLESFSNKTLNKLHLADFRSTLKKLKKQARKSYQENQYAFNNIEISSGDKSKSKFPLGVTLLDIKSILLTFEKKNKKNQQAHVVAQKTCRQIKEDFLNSYAMHFKMQINDGEKPRLQSWARRIYESMKLFCLP